MRRAENVNAPSIGGWILAATAGLVAFALLTVLGDFDLTPAVAVAGVLTVVVGLIVGMPWGASMPTPRAMPAHVPQSAVSQPAAPAAVMAAPVAAATGAEGPARLGAPRAGKADNLKEIEGIGPAMEKLVNEMGFFHFDQIAQWSEADVAWVDANMKNFKGRITRDRWVAQAKIIVNEGLEAFRERAKTNSY
ncbi:MAG: NADH:ubiquinone oxidoreductase [Pseudomonadota bacterium]